MSGADAAAHLSGMDLFDLCLLLVVFMIVLFIATKTYTAVLLRLPSSQE